MTKREFRLENEYHYNRSGPVRWIIAHLLRYPIFPLAVILSSILNNWAYGSIQILIGRGSDVLLTPDWQSSVLLAIALGILGMAVAQGSFGLIRNFAIEFLAQRIERDTPEHSGRAVG